MLLMLWLTLLWPALHDCYQFDFIHGDGFVSVLGDYAKQQAPSPPPKSGTEILFLVNRQTSATRLQATLAAGITAEANLTYSLTDLDRSGGTESPLVTPTRQVMWLDGDVVVSAHIVASSFGASEDGDNEGQPSLDVLLHANTHPPLSASCFRVFAQRNGRERVATTCSLASGANGSSSSAPVCLARLALPLDWSTGAVDVHFALATVDASDACLKTSNFILRTDGGVDEDGSGRYFVGRAQLASSDPSSASGSSGYREVLEDQHVLLDVPDAALRPGSTFSVPVRLQAESDLQIFVMKIRTGKDLRLLDARTADASTWTISYDQSERGGVVTAFVRSSDAYTKMPKVQDVFYCQFEVSPTAQPGTSADARISWILEYESSFTDMAFVSLERKVIATRLKIGNDQTKHIVAVVKIHELVNTRLFRDQTLFVPLWLYAVSFTGTVKAISAADGVQCTARNPKILQVSKKCDGLHVSGDATTGSAGCGVAYVDVQYAQRSRSVAIRVWCPEDRLVLKLSDERLNEVKEWRVPPAPSANGSEIQELDRVTCVPRHQTTDVRVYTRLYALDRDGHVVYMRGGSKIPLLSDVTSLVQHLIQTTDKNVAVYKDNVVVGLGKGKTEVQVVLPNGRVLAGKDVYVLKAKESIERFTVSVVSAASLTVGRRLDVPGVLSASLRFEEKLDDRHQEAILDIWLKFTDDTFVPLSQFDPADYSLTVESQNPGVVKVVPSSHPHQPRIRAVATGKALVEVALHSASECLSWAGSAMSRTARPLAVQFAYVQVDLRSLPATAALLPVAAEDTLELSNDPNSRRLAGKKSKESTYQNDAAPAMDVDKGGRAVVAGKPGGAVVHRMVDEEAGRQQQQPLPAPSQRVSPLNVGMYVVAGVLSVIVAVLAANCIVYARQQQKRRSALPSSAGDIMAAAPVGGPAPVKPSSGWVWIGRGTLEKHAVSTGCGEFMPEPDFARRYSQVPQLVLPQTTSSMTTLSSHTSSVRRSSSTCTSGTYRGSECSVRITLSSRLDDDRCGDGSEQAGDDEGEDVGPVITPEEDDDEAGGEEPDLGGCRQSLPRLTDHADEPLIATEPLSSSSSSAPGRQTVTSDLLPWRSRNSAVEAVAVALPVVVDVSLLTQAEFDSLKESVA